jgi:hypothetical protein
LEIDISVKSKDTNTVKNSMKLSWFSCGFPTSLVVIHSWQDSFFICKDSGNLNIAPSFQKPQWKSKDFSLQCQEKSCALLLIFLIGFMCSWNEQVYGIHWRLVLKMGMKMGMKTVIQKSCGPRKGFLQESPQMKEYMRLGITNVHHIYQTPYRYHCIIPYSFIQKMSIFFIMFQTPLHIHIIYFSLH